MKRNNWISLLITVLIGCTSCHKNEMYNPDLSPGYFNDVVYVGDTVEFHSNCFVEYKFATLQTIKKLRTLKEEWDVNVGRYELTMKRDTVEVFSETTKFFKNEFERMILNKYSDMKDDSLVKLTPDTYCSRDFIIKLYNTYVH